MNEWLEVLYFHFFCDQLRHLISWDWSRTVSMQLLQQRTWETKSDWTDWWRNELLLWQPSTGCCRCKRVWSEQTWEVTDRRCVCESVWTCWYELYRHKQKDQMHLIVYVMMFYVMKLRCAPVIKTDLTLLNPDLSTWTPCGLISSLWREGFHLSEWPSVTLLPADSPAQTHNGMCVIPSVRPHGILLTCCLCIFLQRNMSREI